MPPPYPRPGLSRIRPHMMPGPDGASGPVMVNLASNESAYGPGERAIAAGRAAMSAPERYSEHGPDALADAIGARFGLDSRRIVVGFGSDDLLARLAHIYLDPGSELLRSRNGYPKVPNYAHANDAVPVDAADRNFRADVDAMLAAVTPRTRIVYIANPDNPGGSYIDAADLRRLHRGLPPSVLLAIDAAYEEYVDAADFPAAALLAEEAENVVMTRTFSKIFGLAALRIGWAYGPRAICDALRLAGITFPLSAPALAAGRAALSDRDHTRMVFAENCRLRAQTARALSGLGLTTFPSQGNFLLVRFPAFPGGGTSAPDTAAAAHAALLRRGIATRRFPSEALADCIRITLGREAELAQAVAALDAFVRGVR